MRSVVNSTFVTLDGVINHMDVWHFEFIDDDSDALAQEQLEASDALLMGRKTYEAYASAWPTRTGMLADRINAMPKYVASTTLRSPESINATVLDGDLVEQVRRLKAQDGADILIHGFGPVAKTLLRGDCSTSCTCGTTLRSPGWATPATDSSTQGSRPG